MRQEIWKDVKGYEGLYQVSDQGRVKSLKYNRQRILKACVDSGEYYMVNLSKNGKTKSRRIHQLVAESFLGHKRCGMKLVIDHKNNNRLDNRLDNLHLITQRKNTNRKHLKSSSQYVGVSYAKHVNKWASYIYINGKNKYLGIFDNEIQAAEAYEIVLRQL